MTMPASTMQTLAERGETVAGTFAAAVERLAGAGVAEPRRDARLLISHALGVEPEVVLGFPERMLDSAQARRIARLVALRAERRPMAQILGQREFWSLNFIVTEDTLDPRPDSECVIEAALARIAVRRAAHRILDFGTGTGCLLLALLHELPNATGIGVDISLAACAVAARNAASLGLARRADFAVADWGSAIRGRFDVIVANPPYIPEAELARLEPEVSLFEPRLALDGGPGGVAAYRRFAPDLARLLAPDGLAVVEFGAGQAAPVTELMCNPGLRREAVIADLAGRERAAVFRRPSP